MTITEGVTTKISLSPLGSRALLRLRYLVLMLGSLFHCGPTNAADAMRQIVFIVPHTHWEGAVFKTREEYLELGLPNILKALYLLKQYPNYRFVLDQMCYIRPFIDRYPFEVHTLKEFLSQGRLQIAGGTYTMNDNNMPSGESTVRQYLIAKSYFHERLGYDVTTGWALDTFGHNAQMPQILKLAGMNTYWFVRGASAVTLPTEFLWQGIDGSRIPTFWLPLGYAAFSEIPGAPLEFGQLLRSRFNEVKAFGHRPEEVLLAGNDVTEPLEGLPGLVDTFNKSASGLTAQIAVPSDFERRATTRTDQPVVVGEFNPIGQGIYSNRIELKQAMRSMENVLANAESLSVVASTLGEKTSPERLDDAWEAVLFNEEHDPAAGAVVDKVYDDVSQDYARARHVAEESVSRYFALFSDHVDTAGAGLPLLVFNGLGWRRTDLAQADIYFSEPGVHTFSLLDPNEQKIPIQFISVLRNDDGGMRQARIAFIARDIPSFGYKVYHAVPNTSEAQPLPPTDYDFASTANSSYRDQASVENEFFRVWFDLSAGSITSLILKKNNVEIINAPGNVIAREDDRGDPWELYGNMSRGFVRTEKPTLLPRTGLTQWSNDFGDFGIIISGPVFSEYRTGPRPFGRNKFGTRVRVYNGLPRIDITTELTNQEEFVRYRALFPTTLKGAVAVYEIPFGALERSQRQEYPAQNWVDYGNGQTGITLLNRGIPGNNVADGTLMLSLMRSSNLGAYPFVGGNEPGVSSDTGLGVGKKYTLDYALLPHVGDWRASAPWRAGMEFNNPLIVRSVAAHRGVLPATWGFVDIFPSNVVISALKLGKNGATILRVYEAAGKPTPHVHVTFHRDIKQVREANLIEEEGAMLPSVRNNFDFDLRSFQIETFAIDLEPPTLTKEKAKIHE